jgi:hypothetical protein
MEIRCQELRCGIKVISLDDRPWHIACGNAGCYAKRQFWALYFRKLVIRWAPLIVPVVVVITILVTRAIWDFLVAISWIGLVGLSLFLIVNLAHAFWVSFCPPVGAGTQGSLGGGGSWNPPGGGGTQTFQRDGSTQGSPGARSAQSSPRDEGTQNSSRSEGAQSSLVARDTPIGSALAYIRFRRWGSSFLEAADAQPRAKARAVLNEFLQAAAVGAVQVWGKTHDEGRFEPIEEGYWREHTIDWLSLLKERPFTKRATGKSRDPAAVSYVDLMTSKAQVQKFWPL